jgi:hypothetical protein
VGSQRPDALISTDTATNLDLFNLEDIVDCPDDTEQAAYHYYNDFDGVAPRCTTVSTVCGSLKVSQSLMNFEHLDL